MIKPEVSKLMDSISLMSDGASLSIQKRMKSEEINFLLFKNSIKLSFKRSISRIMLAVD